VDPNIEVMKKIEDKFGINQNKNISKKAAGRLMLDYLVPF
jgi:hypothetical protein